ncbi:MAG: stage II sporulation protein M [Pirellulales bacterium]|nr:stage II sporulation protein M [Pirellulales bacterium]
MTNFLSRNKPDWQELELLIKRANRSTRKLSPEELARLDVLYRRTTIHLAQLSTRTTDRQLVKYVNDLTAAAHSLIYLPPKESTFRGILHFFMEGFARVVARTWQYHAISGALVLAGGLLAFHVSRMDPLTAYNLLPAHDERMPGATPEQLENVLRGGRDQSSGTKFLFASFLFTNNLKVGLLAMAVGVLAAIPTVLLLVYNGMMLGAFAAIHHDASLAIPFWAWILPHGITEVAAIVLCGGVGLLLGSAVVQPGLERRSERLRAAGLEVVRICGGIAIMLLIAAAIESYLRQSHLSDPARLIFAAITAVLWFGYFLHGALREHWAHRPDEVADAI